VATDEPVRGRCWNEWCVSIGHVLRGNVAGFTRHAKQRMRGVISGLMFSSETPISRYEKAAADVVVSSYCRFERASDE
jgi:hypothetical protein